jgi:parallel beta-helix repeat protein
MGGMVMDKAIKNIGIVFMLVTAGFLGFLILTPELVSAGTIIYVDDDNVGGPWDGSPANPFNLIQDGIDAAVSGDTVYVFNGTYAENVIVNKTVNLLGENRTNTYIMGDGTQDVVNVNKSWVNITGFTITNGGPAPGDAGIELDGVFSCNISYCNISDNLGEGIYMVSGSQNKIENNTILNNGLDGIYITMTSIQNLISNSTIFDNGWGISLDGASDLTESGWMAVLQTISRTAQSITTRKMVFTLEHRPLIISKIVPYMAMTTGPYSNPPTIIRS